MNLLLLDEDLLINEKPDMSIINVSKISSQPVGITLPKSHVYGQDLLDVVSSQLIGRVRVVRHVHPKHSTDTHDLLMSGWRKYNIKVK